MSNASALFQIDPGTGTYGTAGVAQNAAAGATINCRLASTVGVDSVQWRIFGTSGVATPAITTSGSPPGQIATFTLPAGTGQAYGVECKVNGGTGVTFGNSTYGDTKTNAVYVLDIAGQRPFFIGETFESDATYGVVPRLNTAFANAGAAIALTVPAWTKYTVTYAQLAAGALTNDIQLFSLPARGTVHAVVIKHSASFTGGAIATYTLSVGIAGTLAKYASAFNVFQASGNTVLQSSGGAFTENAGAATSVRVAATSTGANLNAATAGSATIWVLSSTLPV